MGMDFEKRLRQLELINRVSKRMASSLVLGNLLQDVVSAIQTNFGFFHVMILTVDENCKQIVLQAQAGDATPAPAGYARALGDGIIGRVAQTGQSLLANDVAREPAYRAAREGTRSELCVPIVLEGKVLGVINVESATLNAFGPTDQLILETIADQLAAVMRNASIYNDCKLAKDHLQRLIENSGDAISTADSNGRITFWSPGAQAIFGYSPEEAIGMSVDKFYADGIEEARRIMKLLRKKQKLSNWETEYITKDGRRFPGSLSISMLHDDSGRPYGTLGIIRDISEVRELQQQLLQAERLATIGGLTSQIAHELRNPLSSVKMNINILLKKMERESQEFKYLSLASSGVERLESIMSEMFDYVRPFRLSPGPCDLRGILDAALRQSEQLCQARHIRVERNYAMDLPIIQVDSVRLEQAFVNLYANSVNAMPDGGCLEVSCSRAVNADSEILVSVSDTGHGIDPEHLDRIFEPFFTTRSDGTGLGLSIVKKIIELHGGRIAVESRSGSGTSVLIHLPAQPRIEA